MICKECIPKNKPWRSEPYRRFISEKPCLTCHAWPPNDPHHEPLGKGGKAIKASDTHCVPLCRKCHNTRHRMGRDEFYGTIDVKMVIIEYVTEYLQKEGVC